MRVLHVYKSYYPDTLGGVEQVIAQLAQALAPLGVQSRLFTLSPEVPPHWRDEPSLKVWRSRRSLDIASTPMSLPALRDFAEHVRWADVLHYQTPWPFGDLLQLLQRLRGPRRPAVVSYQSDVVRQRWLNHAYAPLRDAFLRSADAVVTTSPAYRDSSPVLQALRRRGHAVQVIANGLADAAGANAGTVSDPPDAADAALLARWREQLGLQPGDGFLLFVGVLRYYKGLHTLLQAAQGFGGHIVIAGDGPEAAPLREQAAQLGLRTAVHFTGRISDADKQALLRLARGFVFPSHLRSEAFGMSLVEAAMHGLPMISCEIGTGTSFVNLDGVTGRVVPPEDPAALRQAMTELLADPARAQAWGAAARARYESEFSAERMARSYLALYRRLAPDAN